MARRVSTRRKIGMTVLAWGVGLLIFFPILWTVLTSFKTELDAISIPPKFCSSTGRRRTTRRSRSSGTTSPS